MKSMIKLFGVIALVSVIGFSMAGCKEDETDPTPQPTGNDPFAGTWEAPFIAPPPDVQRIVAANGSFSQYAVINGPPKKAHEFIRGTYTVSGNTVNVTMVSFNMKVFSPDYDDSKAEWVTWANLDNEWKTNLGSPSYSITINNNSFTNGNMTFTKM
jgi:hypothetical protein